MNQNLGPQFLDHETLGRVRAVDFPGKIGDPDPVGRMQGWQDKFGGTGEARHYEEGVSPASHVAQMRDSVRSEGVHSPIVVNDWYSDGNYSMHDGHHRAVAAYLEGQGVPAIIKRHNLSR